MAVRSENWFIKIFINGRCPAHVVREALGSTIERAKEFRDTNEVYTSLVQHRCGLESARVVHVRNDQMIQNLLKEKNANKLQGIEVLTEDAAMDLYITGEAK